MSEDIERDPLLRLWALLFFLLKVPYSIAGTVHAKNRARFLYDLKKVTAI